jgi:hypothetical protein
MDPTETNEEMKKTEGDPSPQGATPAWELVEAGRYRPRRIRGSYRGRELG